jgi:peroxiredoxin
MSAVGLALLALAATPAADKVALSGPRLARGDELVYQGEVTETSDGTAGRLVKKWAVEVRLFVFTDGKDGCDCALLTSLTPKPDEFIKEAVKATAGNATKDSAAAVRLDLIRVDDRGRVLLLHPEPTLPLAIDAKTPTSAPPRLPTDGPAAIELGMFLPLPAAGVSVGDTWDTPEPDRPPAVWAAKQTAVWNGRRVADVTGLQQTDGYESPKNARHGWQRLEALYMSPSDGVVSAFTRLVTRREGAEQVGSVKTTLELQPTVRQTGVKYRDTRAEAEAAWAFAAELEHLRAGRAKADVLDAHRREVVRFTDARPGGGGFRPALNAVLRRFEANAAPPVTVREVPPEKAEPPAAGKPAPDFVAADVDRPTGRVRLSAVRGRPAVVVFFKPGSETSEETLTVCEALHRRYGEKVTVIPLALGGDLLAASKQRAGLKYGVPVFDGSEVKGKYAVTSYPQFFVVDADGGVRWAFDAGIGPEVGKLVKSEVEKLLK